MIVGACTLRPTSVPTSYTETTDSLAIFPDYRDIIIPPNIAPLNFIVQDASADAFVAEIGKLVFGAKSDGKIDIDTAQWHHLLSESVGKTIQVTVYARRVGGWVRYAPFTWTVASEPIDTYLSYRLIEPGYELYRQLGLYQRNLTNFEETPIYENNRVFEANENHCVNCHNYQNYDTERMLFHVRASHGGTIITEGKEARKVAIRHDSILASGVYPSWHPTLPLVAFSTNNTGQVFHLQHPEKIEVLDLASDLLLYDASTNAVSHILRSRDALETFPCWSPDGLRLYYCVASAKESKVEESIPFVARYDSLLYDIYSLSFDPESRRFGEPCLEVAASAEGLSASVPRISPDGRYILYTLAHYGQFHIWHKGADLWLKSLTESKGSLGHPLSSANSPDADSYHTWSSNGRWIVFSSRRDDGDFTRPYIAYFDPDGHDHKAFLLPQRDPEQNWLLLKSYNVPELTRSAVRLSHEGFAHVVRHTEATPARYLP
ncbi:MAG: PD40 domain-containing protein [Bacteroidaceae bacterium]|nr:PD40 domain-containing protein [Bacteroidaceae bacterium]